MCYYRYDKKDNTLSRAPEFAEQNYKANGNKRNLNFIEQYKGLSRYGKTVTVLIFITTAVVSTIAVISITKIIKGKNPEKKKEKNNSKLENVKIIEQDSGVTDKKDDF